MNDRQILMKQEEVSSKVCESVIINNEDVLNNLTYFDTNGNMV